MLGTAVLLSFQGSCLLGDHNSDSRPALYTRAMGDAYTQKGRRLPGQRNQQAAICIQMMFQKRALLRPVSNEACGACSAAVRTHQREEGAGPKRQNF